MGKKKAALVRRAWKLLSLALLWARKNRDFRRGQTPDLRLVPDYLKSLRAAAAGRSSLIRYEEREFSFDETPIFHFKMHWPRSMRMSHIPCINGHVDFEDDDDDDIFFDRDERASRLREVVDVNAEERGKEGEEERRHAVVGGEGEPPCGVSGEICCGEEEEAEKKSVDVMAEKFIAMFYERMKLQRQLSLLQYNEILLRRTD